MKLTRKRLMVAGGTALAAGVLIPMGMGTSQAVTPAVTVPAHADVYFANQPQTKAFPPGVTVNHTGPAGSGTWTVDFPLPVPNTNLCSSIASVNTADGSTATAVPGTTNNIVVKTFGPNAAPKDLPFDVIIAC